MMMMMMMMMNITPISIILKFSLTGYLDLSMRFWVINPTN